mgnify:FL=1
MTIKDLVRLSGYSLGTVSRVLNNQPNVSEKARATILAIAAEHGFELNASAQSLKQQKGNSVLVVVKGRNNEMFATMVEQLQTLFSATTHPLIVDFIDEDDNEVQRAAHLCRERKPCGLMLLGGSNQYFFRHFAGISVPAVVVTHNASALPFANLSSVSTDDRKGADCAAEFLLRSGHRHIAMLGGSIDISDTSARRYEGFLDAFRRHGLEFDAQRFYYAGRFSYENGYAGMQAILKRAPEVTAVFAMADVIAIGAMRALADESRRVPDDVSVIGYDGLKIGSFYTPKLTTISQQVELLTRRSFELLMQCMEQNAPARHITVPFTLSARESVRKITD